MPALSWRIAFGTVDQVVCFVKIFIRLNLSVWCYSGYCHQHHIEAILRECEIKPVVNEFEVHPLFTQKPLVKYCEDKGIRVIAYTPLAINDYRLRNSKILRGIANKYNKNIYQIVLRWHIQNGIIPIPYSFNPKHNKSNLDVFDFELTDDEMKVIDGFNYNSRLRYDPDNCDFSIL